MSEELLSRDTILQQFSKIIEHQCSISEFIEQKLCGTCDEADAEEWEARRKKAFQNFKTAIERYKFSKMLPKRQ